MPIDILETMARQGFEELIAIHDRASGLRGFLGIHDTSAGPAFGGIRRWSYRDDSEALRDCLRLSRAMTRKYQVKAALAGNPKTPLPIARADPCELGALDWPQTGDRGRRRGRL